MSLLVVSRPLSGFLAVTKAGEGGGGIPVLPRAGLGGPRFPGSSRDRANMTGGRGACDWDVGFENPLPLMVRGPWTFFGHDCIGHGQF